MFKAGDKVTRGNGITYTILNITNQGVRPLLDTIDQHGKAYIEYADFFTLIKQENNMLDSIKEYIKEHKQVIITIGVVLLVDHLVFGGAFRERVKGLVEKLLNKAETSFDKKGE